MLKFSGTRNIEQGTVQIAIKSLLAGRDLFSKTHFCAYHLPAIIAKMKQSQTYKNGELSSIVLLRGSSKQIVLIVLHGNTEIESFQSNHSATFQIIEGKLNFLTQNVKVMIGKDQILTMYNKEMYLLVAKTEAVLLMTITGVPLRREQNIIQAN